MTRVYGKKMYFTYSPSSAASHGPIPLLRIILIYQSSSERSFFKPRLTVLQLGFPILQYLYLGRELCSKSLLNLHFQFMNQVPCTNIIIIIRINFRTPTPHWSHESHPFQDYSPLIISRKMQEFTRSLNAKKLRRESSQYVLRSSKRPRNSS